MFIPDSRSAQNPIVSDFDSKFEQSQNTTTPIRNLSHEVTQYEFAGRILTTWIPPIEILFGAVGNGLIVFLMTSRQISSPKTRFLLTFLAVTDTFVLFTGLLRHWVEAIAGYDFRDMNNLSCAVHIFLVHFSLHLSSWLLVAITLDRYIGICHPMRAKSSCTLSVTTTAVLLITVAIFVVDSHFLVGQRVTENVCSARPKFKRFYGSIWPWLNLSLTSLVPFVILLTCHVMIMRKLHRRKRFREQSATGSENEKALTNNISAMLLTVNFVFLGTTLPVTLFLLVDGFFFVNKSYPVTYDIHSLTFVICALISYMNNSVNFYVYCFSAPAFRRELVKRLRFRTRKVEPVDLSGNKTVSERF